MNAIRPMRHLRCPGPAGSFGSDRRAPCPMELWNRDGAPSGGIHRRLPSGLGRAPPPLGGSVSEIGVTDPARVFGVHLLPAGPGCDDRAICLCPGLRRFGLCARNAAGPLVGRDRGPEGCPRSSLLQLAIPLLVRRKSQTDEMLWNIDSTAAERSFWLTCCQLWPPDGPATRPN